MKTKLNVVLSAVLAMIFCASLYGNDGVFYVQGNNLIPLQETQVELRKEVLRFYVTQYDWMNVDVDFSFYNPGRSKQVTVGFVTPPASGDTDEDQHPQIKDFTVMVNGSKVTYKVKRMSETSFAFKELETGARDFVYYFPVTFKHGINRIRHTYTYRGGASVEMFRAFDYQITTGKRWANKQIDDFELQVHLDRGIYAIPASFRNDGMLADWKIVGDGVIQEKPLELFSEHGPKVRMTHLNRGYLSLKEENFKPDIDILFAEFNWAAGWVGRWCNIGTECINREALEDILPYFILKPWDGIKVEELAELSAGDLRIIRNYFFAVRGYDFQSDDLKNFYGQFFWYKPDPDLKLEYIDLSDAEDAFVRKVVAAEKSIDD